MRFFDFTVLCCVFFFFQEKDGIRDVAVTGVQTCALPILPMRLPLRKICSAPVWKRQTRDPRNYCALPLTTNKCESPSIRLIVMSVLENRSDLSLQDQTDCQQ